MRRRVRAESVCAHLSRCASISSPGSTRPSRCRASPDAARTAEQIKMLGVDDPLMFLGMAVEPPRPDAVEASLALLRRLGALDSAAADTLTPLGFARTRTHARARARAHSHAHD
jgi:HrpA-like RNA helicase